MYHLLQIGSDVSLINTYAASASGTDVAFVKDYVKRILSRQSEDSDEEGVRW